MDKKILKGILLIFFIALFLELVVFNINSFRLLGNKYQYEILDLKDAELQNLEKNSKYYDITSRI